MSHDPSEPPENRMKVKGKAMQTEAEGMQTVAGTSQAWSETGSAAAVVAVPIASAEFNERRSARRLPLRVPVFVTVETNTDASNGGSARKDYPAETRDVSAAGVYFFVEAALGVNTELEFTLTLPPEITGSDSIRVRCLGTIVRVDSGPPAGVAAIIDEYDLIV